MNSKYTKVLVPKKKRIALVAHDDTKPELFAWVHNHLDLLKNHELCGTGTTSTIIREKFNLDIKSFFSGPLGGDQQIGSAITNGEIDILIFFWDPMSAQPHDPDVKALLRIAVLYDVPTAMSPIGAEYIFGSHLMNEEYYKYIPDTQLSLSQRVDELSD